MIIILDDVVRDLESDFNYSLDWCDLDQDHKHKDLCLSFVDIARKYFNLDQCVGYECWSQTNSAPTDWHYDKDEDLAAKGTLSFPLCSMVYYVHVDKLQGGQLHLENDIITPKKNRLVIFSTGIYHGVSPYQGERVSFLVNPWDRRLNKLYDN